jgi:hypothetical protein
MNQMPSTKYPKFREKIASLNENELRNYAFTSVNVYTNKLCMMDLDFLPDTPQLAEGLDYLQELLEDFKLNPLFTDEQIVHYKQIAKDTAVELLAEEGYTAGENPFGG